MAKQNSILKMKLKKVMGEYKAGTLKTSAGKKVTDPHQALAIGFSEARAHGANVPKKSGGIGSKHFVRARRAALGKKGKR